MDFINTREHHDLMTQFEKSYANKRLDREKNKNTWRCGNIYENGEVNELFKAYRLGYSLGRIPR